MIWHVVRLDFAGVDEHTRVDIEARLGSLADLEPVGWLRVGRDVDQPTVTGLLTAFADADALAAYRTHSRHVPVVEALRAAGVRMTRFDIVSDDEVGSLPG